MAKVNVRKQIKEAKKILKEVMQEHLTEIAELLVDQIMSKYSKLPESKKADAIKDLLPKGIPTYKSALLKTMAVIAGTALEAAREEIPKKSSVELTNWRNEQSVLLGEFEELPPKIKKRLKSQMELLVKTQKADLDKVVLFQFSSSLGSTDSHNVLRFDLMESADDFVLGPSVDGGAGVMAARGINEARQAFFFDDDVLEGVDAFIFKNDIPETPICEDLNGTVFSADDPNFLRYTPPLHYNCDSYILPILKGNLNGREITQLKPSKSDLEKYIQFSEHEADCCGRSKLVEL